MRRVALTTRIRPQAKRAYATDQHVCVTCGRTDSPEWRKVRRPCALPRAAPRLTALHAPRAPVRPRPQGPHGPKTLCNACGLRWAKKVRKFEEANEAGGGGEGSRKVLDTTVPP